MKDMIARILEMDLSAQDLEKEMQRDKLDLEKEMKNNKDQIRKDYLERARARIEKNRKVEQLHADEKLEEILEEQKKLEFELNEKFRNNKENWVKQIFKNVLEGVAR